MQKLLLKIQKMTLNKNQKNTEKCCYLFTVIVQIYGVILYDSYTNNILSSTNDTFQQNVIER